MSILGIYKEENRILVHGENPKGKNKLTLEFDGTFRYREKDSYLQFRRFITSLGPYKIAMLSKGKNTPIGIYSTSQWQELQITTIEWDPDYFDILLASSDRTYANPAEALCKLSHTLSILSFFWPREVRQNIAKIRQTSHKQKPAQLPIPKRQPSTFNLATTIRYISSTCNSYLTTVRSFPYLTTIRNFEIVMRLYMAWYFTLLIACFIGHILSRSPESMKYLLNSKQLLPLTQHPILLKLILAQVFIGTYFLINITENKNPIYNLWTVLFFVFETFFLGLLTAILLHCFNFSHLIYQFFLLTTSILGFLFLQRKNIKIVESLKYSTNKKHIATAPFRQAYLVAFFILAISNLFFSNTLRDLYFLSGVSLATPIRIRRSLLFYKGYYTFEHNKYSAPTYENFFLLASLFLFLLYAYSLDDLIYFFIESQKGRWSDD